jgi:4-hydroxy-3-methylbut-2-enyl diphosphate reductase
VLLQRLKEMDIEIIEDKTGTGKDFDPVQEGDVVILPAFGASVSEMRLLSDRKVQLVDTTCPWVSKVWNAVDNQSRKAHTSIIHGKYSHEETVATASFATTYLVVRDIAEAEYVADYIANGGSKAEFLDKFKNSVSAGFDPDTDLERLGLANQTTMLRDETLQIGKLLEKTMMEKYGPAELKDRYMVMDTICDATQTRQSAVYELTASQDQADKKVDMMIVVGGFNSSNTSHLQEIPELRSVPSYWVNSAACIDVDSNKVMHKSAHGDMNETKNWIPDGPLVIGVTSGASTPDRAVEDVLDKVFQIRDPSYAGVPPRLEPAVPAKPEE